MRVEQQYVARLVMAVESGEERARRTEVQDPGPATRMAGPGL